MKRLAHLTAGLVLFAGYLWAESAHDEVGRIDLGQGVQVEYEMTPIGDKANVHKDERIGPVFGTDGGTPHTKLKKLTLLQGNEKTSLEVSCMYDPWFEQVDRSRFKVVVRNRRRVVLTGVFSDAAGSYVAEWLIVDGLGVRTLLSNDPSVVRQKLLH